MHYNIGNHFRKRELTSLNIKETLSDKYKQADSHDAFAVHYDIKPGDL